MISKSIPSLLTLGNLCLGVLSILLVFNDYSGMAAIMIIIGMLIDGIDGRVARALNAQSEFGKELDSLADIITFGVAPAFIMYVVALQDVAPAISWIVTALFPICGALRLARFNVKASAPGSFTGLPIPAAGCILATVALFKEDVAPLVFIVTSIVLALLMVSNIRYPSFKGIGIPRKTLWIVPIIIVIALVVGILFEEHLSKVFFIPLILYALYGVKKSLNRRMKRKKRETQEEEQSEKHA
ncbi:CDP-diacylglycerol--serine O-phosphatidyltransferase [Paenibacillus septentrionalis]|uniref:CDP-diacylglycerol--serine O-phosphatidyltransferase n=1 Tax=Paenibacillus septentrionalis TaxID=429342 RepID=A0ABW1V891_9BACL